MWQSTLLRAGIYMTWSVSTHTSHSYRTVHTVCHTNNKTRYTRIYTRNRHQHLTMKAVNGNTIILKMERKRLHIRKHDKWVIRKKSAGLKIVK